MDNKTAFETILRGATRKALQGEKPFPSEEEDGVKMAEEFASDFREASPIFGVNYEKIVGEVIESELKI